MGWSSKEYKKQLQSLLPKGPFWTRAAESILGEVLYGEADELARFDARTEDLITESYTSQTTELIAEHELDYGVDTEDVGVVTSLQDRRDIITAKLIAVGGQNKEYFEEIATNLEYEIEIFEPVPFRCGVSTCGDTCGDAITIFRWIVYVLTENLVESRQVNLSRLIFEISSRKPGHTQVFFRFYGNAFSRAFGRGFDRIPFYDNSWLELDFGREFDDSFANAYDYDGVNLIGAYDKSFGLDYDRDTGGGFSYDDFSTGYDKLI